MKCTYITDVPVCVHSLPADEKTRLAALAPDDPNNIRYKTNPDRHGKPIPYWPVGATREIRGGVTDAVWHCQRGICIPADEECATALGYTPEQLAQAQHVYKRIVDGIYPEDFEAYDTGVMIGYAPNGSWIPGPNFDKYQAAKTAEKEKSDI